MAANSPIDPRIQTVLARLRDEFTANAKVRLGVWCILALVIFYWILVRSDDLQAARAEYAGAFERVERARDASAEQDWPALLAAERDAGADLTANLWEAETEGVAQARLLATLNELAGEIEMSQVRIEPGVTQPVAGAPDVWRVQARLIARYRIGAELRLLHALATHPKTLKADRLDFGQSRARINLLVSAYFVGLEP